MEVRLFGPVEVLSEGHPLDIGPAKWRSIFAALAITPQQVVPLDVLVDRVWGEQSPARPRATLYPYVTRLRQALEPAGIQIVSRSGGYVCEAPPDSVDLVRFRRLTAEARELPPAACVESLRTALALWRDRPLADLAGDWADQVRDTLARERLAAALQLGSAQAGNGALADSADDLVALAADYPLSEPLAGFAIRALAAAGRRAEALDHYARTREHLVEELGEDPGAELRQLHLDLLQDSGTTAASARPFAVVPRQLPAPPSHFAGRAGELRMLDELTHESSGGSTFVISAIAGMAGIGKTALALHWAHRSSDRFPDGQLYVNLRGYDPSGEPTPPDEALRGFLEALSVPPERIPRGLDGKAGLYRSLLAKRRVLVLLDNAHDAEQVRALLPGNPTCVTIVTSRDRLTGLLAGSGARPVPLDLLDFAEAERLLAGHVGPDRIAAEPEAVAALIGHCGHLPLALTIAGARAAWDPTLPLGKLAAELAEARLNVLDTSDPATTARTVFSWSYNALAPEARRLFRLLGTHPGPDVSAPAAASLASRPLPATGELLDVLRGAHLLTEPVPGRYGWHDLLRAYATELAATDAEAGEAGRRMLDHYVHTTQATATLLSPLREPASPEEPAAGVAPERFDDRDQAVAWYGEEYHVVVNAVRSAAEAGLDRHAWLLARNLNNHLEWGGHWYDLEVVQRTALEAAQRLGDVRAEAMTRGALGGAYLQQRRSDDARTQLLAALELMERMGNHNGMAMIHHNLGVAAQRDGDMDGALGHAQEALTCFRAGGHRAGEADALMLIGWNHALRGDPQQALEMCEQSQVVRQENGLTGLYGEAATWECLGYAQHHLGRHAEALANYGLALARTRELDVRYDAAKVLFRMGDTYAAVGSLERARSVWEEALETFADLDHPDAAEVRERLESLT